MKALSLIQPWASLIAMGEKRIETRSWLTKYRGPLAIHASKRVLPYHADPSWNLPFRLALPAPARQLPRGCVIATCMLVGCLPTELVIAAIRDGRLDIDLGGGCRLSGCVGTHELAFGDFAPGRFAWLLDYVKRLDRPIQAKGGLGLWEFSDLEAA